MQAHQELSPPRPEALGCLRRLSSRYVWWKTTDEAMQFPDRVAAQVMNLGTFEDLTALIETVGEEHLRDVLRHAEAGQPDALLALLALSPRTRGVWHKAGAAGACEEERVKA